MQTLSPTLPEFLEDWKPDHRQLSPANRERVGRYIEAILHRTGSADADPAEVALEARRIWLHFRTTFDDLLGPFQRSEREDVARAMTQL
jgi:hypothetical protein